MVYGLNILIIDLSLNPMSNSTTTHLKVMLHLYFWLVSQHIVHFYIKKSINYYLMTLDYSRLN